MDMIRIIIVNPDMMPIAMLLDIFGIFMSSVISYVLMFQVEKVLNNVLQQPDLSKHVLCRCK